MTFSVGTIWLSTSMAQFMVTAYRHCFQTLIHSLKTIDYKIFHSFKKDINIKLFQPSVSNFLILVWLLVYCFYGNLITSKCLQVADFVYESQFYNYPHDLKIFTLLMMQRSQRPFYITGYKITMCSLESYSRVRWNGIEQ